MGRCKDAGAYVDPDRIASVCGWVWDTLDDDGVSGCAASLWPDWSDLPADLGWDCVPCGKLCTEKPSCKDRLYDGVALVVLGTAGIHELVLGAYFSNAAGIWTQLYYLPLLQLGFSLTSWSSRVFTADAAAWLLMAAASYLGFRLGRRQSVK